MNSIVAAKPPSGFKGERISTKGGGVGCGGGWGCNEVRGGGGGDGCSGSGSVGSGNSGGGRDGTGGGGDGGNALGVVGVTASVVVMVPTVAVTTIEKRPSLKASSQKRIKIG